MRIDFRDEKIRPLAADMANIAAAYFAACGVDKNDREAYEKLMKFVRKNPRGKKEKPLAYSLIAVLPDYAEFAAAVLENFR